MPDYSKIGKSNVRKSKVHERRIAKLLAEWSGVPFRRRRVEGREANVTDLERTGDVIPACPEWVYFNIEAKSGKGGTLDALLKNPAGTKFTEWWHQASYDAMLATDSFNRVHPDDNLGLDYQIYPMLFFKPHPNHDWVAISKEGMKRLWPKDRHNVPRSDSLLWFPAFQFDYYNLCGKITYNVSHTKNKNNEKLVPLHLDACYLCRWKDFADNVDPRSFFISWPAVETEKAKDSESQEAISK